MKLAPALDADALTHTIRRAYGFQIAQLVFVPRGETADCFVATCDNGNDYFVKVLRPSRLGRASAARLAFYLPLMWNLYARGAFRRVPYPVQTQRRTWYTHFHDHPLIVLSYIPGETLDTWPTPEQQAPLTTTLAHSIAALHTSTTRFTLNAPSDDPFDLTALDDLPAMLAALDDLPTVARPGQHALRARLDPLHMTLTAALAHTHTLRTAARHAASPPVLCHADLTPDNLLLDAQGELYILDWETATLGPPEQDLATLPPALLAPFLTTYAEHHGPTAFDARVLAFYRYRHLLTNVTHWIARMFDDPPATLAERESHAAHDAYVLAELERECLALLPTLAETLAADADVLSTR